MSGMSGKGMASGEVADKILDFRLLAGDLAFDARLPIVAFRRNAVGQIAKSRNAYQNWTNGLTLSICFAD
jgi:3-deoxy-D-arabino-heptulosonate 7-phosphate (DAHP) synthase class II